MKFSELDLVEDFDLSLLPAVLAPVQQYFKALGFEYQQPIITRVKNIADKSTPTNFPGIYFMYGTSIDTGAVIDFYIGKAEKDTVFKRWITHVPKLQQNANALFYRTPNPREGPRRVDSTWENPTRYRAGVAKQFYAGQDMPDYRVPVGKQEFVATKGKNKGKVKTVHMVAPGDLTYKGKTIEGRNVMDLPVMIWNLSNWPVKFIGLLEDAMIRYYKPEFNNKNDTSKPQITVQELQEKAAILRQQSNKSR
jgi:hypothetical protein